MVRLVPTNSEVGAPDPFLALVVVLISLLTLAVIAWGTLGSFSQVAAASRSAGADANPSLLLEWIDQTGRPTVIRANIARAFGLADQDIPVKERGFNVSEEQFTHVCSIGFGAGYEGLVFLASVDESNGSATVWRTDKNGVLLATVTFDDGAVENVPNWRFAAQFGSELDHFLKRARSAKFRADSGPTPRDRRSAELSDAPNGLGHTPRYAPFLLETMLIASSPLALPAIITILATGALSARKRR